MTAKINQSGPKRNRMNKMHYILLVISVVLIGCVSDNTKLNNEYAEDYNQVSTGEKKLLKAFLAYDMIGDCWNAGKCYELTSNGIYYNSCHGGGAGTDFVARFIYRPSALLQCYTGQKLERNAHYIQIFDKNNGLSEKEISCLQLWNDDCYKFEFMNNEDECIIIRRQLLKNEKLVGECLFDYNDYLPQDMQIGSFEKFEKLYKSWIDSVSECMTLEKNNQITTAESEECIINETKKAEKIAKSGVLK